MPRTPVSLNIKSKQVHDAAAKLARLQGTTITTAVLKALLAELDRCEHQISVEEEVRRMERVSNRVAALQLLDARSNDEILGYGKKGFLIGN